MKPVLSQEQIASNMYIDESRTLRLSSLIIADGVNKKHSHIMALVATYKEDLEAFGPVLIADDKKGLSDFEQSVGEKLIYHKKPAIEYVLLTDYQLLFIINHLAATPFIRDFIIKVLCSFNNAGKNNKA